MAVVVQRDGRQRQVRGAVHRRPGPRPQGPHGRRGRPRPGRGRRLRRGHPGQLHARPRRGGEEEQGRRGGAGPVRRRAAPRWPRWDGSWPNCTEAPRTSSGPSTPTAGCSCCSRVPSPRSEERPVTWMAPRTVAEAVRLKAEWPDATLVAGGTFVGILTRQGLLASDDWISLQYVRELRELSTSSELALGAMVTHRRIELDPDVAAGWPGVRQVFAAVASPRVRNAATIGGVLGDADYASDPPAMLVALDAWVEALERARPAPRSRRRPHPRPLPDQPGGGRAHHAGPGAAGPPPCHLPQAAHPQPGGSAERRGRRLLPRGPRVGGRRRGRRPSPALPRPLRDMEAGRRPPAPARSRPATPTASIPSATTAARRPTGPG